MNIGLDLDNVLNNFDEGTLKEILSIDKLKRNKGIINKNADYITKGMLDWSDEEFDEFYNNNMERIASELEVKNGCREFIDKLLVDGHKVYIISHRCFPHYKEPEKTTKEWLNNKKINYTDVIFSKSPNKTEECKKLDIDFMIDDRLNACLAMKDEGINVLLFATEYNVKKAKNYDIEIVNNFNEIYKRINTKEIKNVILDTDISNEIDDQFALCYLLKSLNNINLEAITIAPFSSNGYIKTKSVEEGTNISISTTNIILDLLNKKEFKNKIFKGAVNFLADCEKNNDATNKIIEIAKKNKKTYIVAIGAITNVALAIKKHPEIINRIEVIWLGGNSFLSRDNIEYNFRQDIKAVQTIFESKVNLTVIPCRNVASSLDTTIFEIEHYLKNKGEIGNYLCDIFSKIKKHYMNTKKESIGMAKTLWDLSAVAYIINRNWFEQSTISCPRVLDNSKYELTENRHKVVFVNDMRRSKIFQDFFIKMGALDEN